MTSILPPSREMNNMWHYAYDYRAHVTETSPLVTVANRNLVYAEWRRYWDVSKPILVRGGRSGCGGSVAVVVLTVCCFLFRLKSLPLIRCGRGLFSFS